MNAIALIGILARIAPELLGAFPDEFLADFGGF
jgi:hypothetical protein